MRYFDHFKVADTVFLVGYVAILLITRQSTLDYNCASATWMTSLVFGLSSSASDALICRSRAMPALIHDFRGWTAIPCGRIFHSTEFLPAMPGKDHCYRLLIRCCYDTIRSRWYLVGWMPETLLYVQTAIRFTCLAPSIVIVLPLMKMILSALF